MYLKKHFMISLVLASLFYLITHSIGGFLSIIIVGVFIDVDHGIDMWIEKRRIFFSYKQVLEFSHTKQKRTYIFFHSFELVILIYLLGKMFLELDIVHGINIGIVGHLICDWIGNTKSKISKLRIYFIIYRALRGFDPSRF